MALPYKVKDISTVPEAARDLYEKKGEEYVLKVEGELTISERLRRAEERTK